jgi:hypothetical protein
MSILSVRNRRAAVASAGFVALLALIAFGLDRAYGVESRHDRESKVNWVFGMRGTTPGFVILGSSRAAVTIDAGALGSQLGVRGINVSQIGAGYEELALVWDMFTQRNRTEHLLLEVDLFGFDTTILGHPFHEYSYLPYLGDTTVASSIRKAFGARALVWQYVPLFKYAEFNDRIGLKSILHVAHRAKPNFDSTGSELRNGTMNDSLIRELRDTTYGFDSSRLASLERILSIANDRRIRVTMFMAPEYVAARMHVRNRDAIVKAYRKIAERHGAEYLVLADEAIAEDRENFYNPEHLNRSGAELFTRLLGDSLLHLWARPPAVNPVQP